VQRPRDGPLGAGMVRVEVHHRVVRVGGQRGEYGIEIRHTDDPASFLR